MLALISTAGRVETAEEEEVVCAAFPYAGAGDIDEALKNVLQYSGGAKEVEEILRFISGKFTKAAVALSP